MKKTLSWITILLSILAGCLIYAEWRETQASILLSGTDTVRGSFDANTIALEDWVDRLGELEGCSPLGTPDSGSLSYGKFCFKKDTWIWMFEEYNEATNAYPHIEETEYMNLIGDNELARKVVIWNIAKEPNRDLHWSPVKTGLIERAPRI